MLINLDRLYSYITLLFSRAPDPGLKNYRLTHTITQPGEPMAYHLPDLKAKFVRHRMYRQLREYGDL